MADQTPPIEFEYIPLAHARQLTRGPRLDPELYQTLKATIQSLSDQAVRMTLPEGARFTTMKNRILRVAAEVQVRVTVRRVPEASSSGAHPPKISSKPKISGADYRPPYEPEELAPADAGEDNRIHSRRLTFSYVSRRTGGGDPCNVQPEL